MPANQYWLDHLRCIVLLARSLSTLKYIPQALKILFSGDFESKKYRQYNPDIGRYPAALHWVKYREEDGRQLGQAPFSLWLIPHLLDGSLSVKNMRGLRKVKNNPAALQKRATSLGLNFNDFTYHQALDAGQFEAAYQLLTETSLEVFFDGAYYFAASHMRLDYLPRAFDLTKSIILSTNRQRKKTDMAQALGKPVQESALALIETLKHSEHSLDDQIFKARLPLISAKHTEACEYFRGMKTAGLHSVSQTTDGRCGAFARGLTGFENMITAATYNTIHASPICIIGMSPETSKIVPLSEHDGPIIKMRILMPRYWVSPQKDNRVTGAVLALHMSLIRQNLSQGLAITPVYATPIFDITDENNYGLNTLSYHTITREKKAEDYTHYKEAYLPDNFIHDPYGYSGWSALSSQAADDFIITDDDYAAAFHTGLYQQYCIPRDTKYAQTETASTLPDTPFIFAALQVPDDTVAVWAQIPQQVWLQILSDFAQAHDLQLVIKAHPKDNNHFTKNILKTYALQSHVHISGANIHDLMAQSLAVVTVNSGVGFEALLHHKPVITCGHSDYQAVTYAVQSTTELESALTAILHAKYPASQNTINHFLYAYMTQNCWRDAPYIF